MANLSLDIRGLALCHFMESTGIWKVFFPRVNGHIFELRIIKKTGDDDHDPAVFVLPPSSKINISTDNADTGVRTAEDWDEAVDLSGQEYHAEPIHLVSNERKYAGVLTLNGARLVSKKAEEPEKFQVWDARKQEKRKIKDITPANIFSGQIPFESGELRITVENNFNIGFGLSFPYEDDVSYSIEISNDCSGQNCDSILDFKYLYEIIDETKFNVKRRMELIATKDFDFNGERGFPGSRCGGSGGSDIANPDVI